ncbi:hypothetical protein [Saccharicrinis sp. FJH54]|uniref:hypothetical protein n=1 Tax=Saccharicrinis sp. FJH54 TaxID=3344665 RepID=UPI0035D51CEE
MKLKVMLILLFLIYRFWFATVPSATKPEGEQINLNVISDWNCVKDKNGIRLFERWIKLSNELNVRERKGEMILDCNYTKTVSYLGQTHTIKDWMKSVTVVEPAGSESESLTLKHIVFQLPWPLDNRDVIALYNVYPINENRTVISVVSSESGTEYPGIVRIKVYRATWNIEKISTASTKIIFTTFSDEPPLFPLWIQEPVIKREYFNNLSRLKLQLENL